MPASDQYLKKVQNYYSDLLTAHGDDVRSVDWGGEPQQRLRFDVLVAPPVFNASSILDVGCGRGDLYSYLKDRNFAGTYTGVDVTPGMVDLCRKKFPGVQFEQRDLLNDPLADGSFDFVIASGIFYLRNEDNWAFFRDMSAALFKLSRTGLAFNMLSFKTSHLEEQEFYFEPEKVLQRCFELTPYVSCRHDYKGNDFTLHLYKRPSGDLRP